MTPPDVRRVEHPKLGSPKIGSKNGLPDRVQNDPPEQALFGPCSEGSPGAQKWFVPHKGANPWDRPEGDSVVGGLCGGVQMCVRRVCPEGPK